MSSAATTKLGRRRGAPSKKSVAPLIVGIVLALIVLSLLLGILLGANLLGTNPTTTKTTGAGAGAGANTQQRLQQLRGAASNAAQKLLHHDGKEDGDYEDEEEEQPILEQQQHAEAKANDIDTTKQQQQQQAANERVSVVVDAKTYPYKLEPTPADFDFTTWKAPGGDRFQEWKKGDTPYTWDQTILTKSDEVARSRRAHVKNAMKFAYNSYEKYAMGHDEVLPQSKGPHDNWGGIGTTLIDALDTLWLMDLKDEFWRGRDWVRDHLDHNNCRGTVSVFETTIRSLGGLLAAYDWSKDGAFLHHAADLGSRLFHAFDNPSGLPWGTIDLNHPDRTGNIGWAGGAAIVAELGTLQVEFRYLSKMLNGTHPEYATKSEHVFEILNDMNPPHGLYPYFIRSRDDKPEFANRKLTFGAMADSVYEYMLKVWLQGGKTEPLYRQMYDKAIQGMHDELLQTSTPSGLTFIADKNNNMLDKKMDHLVCFMGGLLALGAYTDPLGLDSERAQRDLRTGKALTYTCYQMYARMPTGISAEFVQFHDDRDFDIGQGAPHYLLRPEAVESFFILSYLTKDPVYREWSWEVFCAIERYCKTDIAYGSLHTVRDINGKPENKMESFFLAETLKYLYLAQDPETEVDILHKHVFNTEAHPTRIFPLIDDEALKKKDAPTK